jgi:O-antigen ligase
MFCLLFGQNRKIRMLLPFLFAAVCVVCKYIDCNTSVLGTAVFFLVAYAPDRVREVLGRKRFALIVIVICAMFVFFDSFAQIPPVKYFITEVLGRDVTLTGRAQIFKILPKIIRGSPWLGYGSSSEIMHRYTGAYNAQNGFFDLVVQNGIPSAVLYVVLIVALIRKGESRDAAFVLGATYGYFVMSTVEMTFGSTLMLFGILLFTDSDVYRDEPVTIIEWSGQVS